MGGESYNDIYFYTHQQEEIYDPDKYRNLVNGLIALNFYVASPGDQIDQKQLTTPGSSPYIQQEIQDAQKIARVLWDLQIYSLDPDQPFGGFSFEIGNDRIDEEDETYGSIYLDYRYRLFDESTNELEMYEHFLDALRLIYEAYHPIYAYQSDAGTLTTLEEAQTAQIHTLYSINFFGPELVEKLGRERIASAPAERITSLSDGGIMLLPLIPFSPQARHYSYKKAAQYLELSES